MSIVSILLSTTDWISVIKILILLYVVRFYYNYYTRKSPLPGPLPLPLIGNFYQFGLNPAQYVMDHKGEFGDIYEIWVGSVRAIVLSSPSLIEQVFVPNTKTKFFPRSRFPLFVKDGLIFNDDLPSWKRSRKFVVQSLMSSRFLRELTHLTQSIFNENESFWDKNEYEIDFAEWSKCFSTDIILQTVTRKPFYCLHAFLFGVESSDPIKSEGIKRSVKFNNAIDTFFSDLTFKSFTPELLRKYVPGFYHLGKKYEKNVKWLTDTMLDIIGERRSEIDNMQSDEKVGSNLLDILLTSNTPRDPSDYDESESPLTDQEICAIITEICAANSDTTGNTLCYTIWSLAKHPKVYARFQEEINKNLGDDISREITYKDLEKFTYLDAILKESMRFVTLAPLTSRVSTQECVIGGYHWDARTPFFVSHEEIHRSDVWKDPDQFIPERFLKESNNEEIIKNSFIPFGGGTRICPGRHAAVVELKTLLILLFRKYDIELVDKVSEKPKMRYVAVYFCNELNIIMRPKKGINV